MFIDRDLLAPDAGYRIPAEYTSSILQVVLEDEEVVSYDERMPTSGAE